MSNNPDYPLADAVVADRPDQFKALGDPLRSHILDLALERALTVSDLAGTLGRPKGTIAHHVGVLVEAGLLTVVRTRQVRAITERFYGRTGRTIHISSHDGDDPLPFVREAEREVDTALSRELGESMFTLRHARIPPERALEFAERALALAVEFTELPRAGAVEFGFLVGVYPTTRRTVRPALPTAPPEPAALNEAELPKPETSEEETSEEDREKKKGKKKRNKDRTRPKPPRDRDTGKR